MADENVDVEKTPQEDVVLEIELTEEEARRICEVGKTKYQQTLPEQPQLTPERQAYLDSLPPASPCIGRIGDVVEIAVYSQGGLIQSKHAVVPMGSRIKPGCSRTSIILGGNMPPNRHPYMIDWRSLALSLRRPSVAEVVRQVWTIRKPKWWTRLSALIFKKTSSIRCRISRWRRNRTNRTHAIKSL